MDDARRAARAAHPRGSRLRASTAFYRVWIVVGAFVLGGYVLNLLGVLSNVLLFLAVGCIVAFMATPIVNRLERLRVPRGIGALAGVAAVIVAVLLLFTLLIPALAAQVVDMLRDLPQLIANLGAGLAELEARYDIVEHLVAVTDADAIVASLQSMLGDLMSTLFAALRDGIVPAVNNVASTVFTVFLALVFAYWLASDYPRINDEICTVLGPEKEDDWRLMVAVMGRSVGGYLRSMVINSFIQGLLAFLGFWIVGHPYAGIMGVLSGVLNFIPVVGPSISAAIATGIALFFSPVMAFWTLVMAVISQNVTDNVIAPKINESTMQVHPVLSLTALVVGSTLLGAVGMIIALPLCAIAKSLFIFYYESRSGRQIVAYDGALFKGTPFRDEQGGPVAACDALGDPDLARDSALVDERLAPVATAVDKPEEELSGGVWDKVMEYARGHRGEDGDDSET